MNFDCGSGKPQPVAGGFDSRHKKELGRDSEQLACDYIEERGCVLVARNFRCREGELDLVFYQGDTLIFVEVRSSSSSSYLQSPSVSVDSRKKSHIVAVAERFIHRTRIRLLSARFDVVAVRWAQGEATVDWIKDAFRPRSTARDSRFR